MALYECMGGSGGGGGIFDFPLGTHLMFPTLNGKKYASRSGSGTERYNPFSNDINAQVWGLLCLPCDEYGKGTLIFHGEDFINKQLYVSLETAGININVFTVNSDGHVEYQWTQTVSGYGTQAASYYIRYNPGDYVIINIAATGSVGSNNIVYYWLQNI